MPKSLRGRTTIDGDRSSLISDAPEVASSTNVSSSSERSDESDASVAISGTESVSESSARSSAF